MPMIAQLSPLRFRHVTETRQFRIISQDVIGHHDTTRSSWDTGTAVYCTVQPPTRCVGPFNLWDHRAFQEGCHQVSDGWKSDSWGPRDSHRFSHCCWKPRSLTSLVHNLKIVHNDLERCCRLTRAWDEDATPRSSQILLSSMACQRRFTFRDVLQQPSDGTLYSRQSCP